jgi:hypothetical protein
VWALTAVTIHLGPQVDYLNEGGPDKRQGDPMKVSCCRSIAATKTNVIKCNYLAIYIYICFLSPKRNISIIFPSDQNANVLGTFRELLGNFYEHLTFQSVQFEILNRETIE